MRFSDLKNERVAILGAGREGQSVWRHLRSHFPAKPLCFFAESDIDSEFLQELDPTIDEYHIGPLNPGRLKQYDVFMRSAGISPYRSELKELRTLGKRFTSASNLWFAENPGAKTICISGTMGKSTTAALTAHLLACAGVNTCLAGNIGLPMLDRKEENVDWWVIELSSYQISDLEAKPDIVLLLNVSEEHVDWHGGVQRYRADKLRLAELAGNERLIANFTDAVLVEELKKQVGVRWFNHKDAWQAGEDGAYGCNNRFVATGKKPKGMDVEDREVGQVIGEFGQPTIVKGVFLGRLQETTVARVGNDHLIATVIEPGTDDPHLDAWFQRHPKHGHLPTSRDTPNPHPVLVDAWVRQDRIQKSLHADEFDARQTGVGQPAEAFDSIDPFGGS